jgi:hypothetical protein
MPAAWQGGAGPGMPGEPVLESVRRSVSRWPLWELPRWLQALVAGMVAVYCAAVCAALALTRVQAGQLQLFVLLVDLPAPAGRDPGQENVQVERPGNVQACGNCGAPPPFGPGRHTSPRSTRAWPPAGGRLRGAGSRPT